MISSQSFSSRAPILKWAGGKRWLAKEILSTAPEFSGRYIEPFLGGGAVFFSFGEEVEKLGNDSNPYLIEVYETIRDHPLELITELRTHQNNPEYYNQIRSWDRRTDFAQLSPLLRASRFIYLNKTCFNGLYRVNKSGHFNVPFGKQPRANFVMEDSILALSQFLNHEASGKKMASLTHGDYKSCLRKAQVGDFVYLDPPYDPVSTTSSFVNYQSSGFGKSDQIEIQVEATRLAELGIPVLISNSDTPFIRSLFDSPNFQIKEVLAPRSISASGGNRSSVGELLISNYPIADPQNTLA